MKYGLVLAPLSAVALAACGDATVTGDNAASNMAAADVGPAMDNAVSNMTMPDDAAPLAAQQFADTVAASDAFEIESSKLAQEKATRGAVKEFAAMMVKDHTNSTAKLKEAAAKAEPAITPNPALDPEQTANLEALRATSGEAFDTLYKQQQIAAHQKALSTLQSYAANGDVPALRTFAAETAKVVEGHLKHANSM